MAENPGDLFNLIRTGAEDLTELDEQFPFFGLDAPGMPLPGPDFVALAHQMGDNPVFLTEGKGRDKRVTCYGRQLHYLYRRALYDECFQMGIKVKGRAAPAPFVPGHILGDPTDNYNGGPQQARVMVIGKHPGQDEVKAQRNFVGATSTELFDAAGKLGVSITDMADWYITNVVKFPQLDRQSDGLPTAWLQDCLPLLHQELRLVRPDYILCLGTHASKALLGSWAAVSNMVGRVEEIKIPIMQQGEDPVYHNAKVMTAMHPAAVYRRRELYEPFKDQLGLFVQLTEGVDVGGTEENIDHRVIYSEKQLRHVVDEARADPARGMIAVDCEWHGEFPTNPGAYLRSVQFSTRHGEGITVVLRHQGGHPAFKPGIQHAVRQLNRLFKTDVEAGYYPRIGGHAFRADLPWLLHEGIDVRAEYMAPATPQRGVGGFETTLMYHATNEAASFRLEDVAARLTTAPRYDQRLGRWKTQYCKVHGIAVKDLEGYGMCPDWILHPSSGCQIHSRTEHNNYACYDPDVTRRIAIRCEEEGGLLDSDWFKQSSWKAYWTAHRASPAFLEMEMNGITLDRDRVDKLSRDYQEVKRLLLANFRAKINWPHFNPESAPQCVAFLFGDKYGYKLNKQGQKIPIRPPGAVTLELTPIKSTGRRSTMWDIIKARKEEDHYTPSSDKEVLGILGHQHPLAMQLRDLKFISQCLKSVLRPPMTDGTSLIYDEKGNLVYSKGLASFIHADGLIRTHLSQLKETGRAASARPPLQNISKRREDDYARILGHIGADGVALGDYLDVLGGPRYTYPIRTIFKASPGHVLVEADYVGAELAVIAWLANDPAMIDHTSRNILPEDHPNHYDIHSRTAVKAFRLTCAATKSALKKAGKKGLRVAAKNVNFGIPYGRMALAIQRQCREEGVNITIAETQRLIDIYFSTYVQTTAFLEECRNRVGDPHWICTPFGRRRRFIKSLDKQVTRDQERQAQNFPIQSTVADAVNRALDAFYYYRLGRPEMTYRIVLQIHDAILFEVPILQLRPFLKEVLPECMINRVPISPTHLDGTPMTNIKKPYYFGIDTDVQINWGEDITEAQATALGIPLDLI